MNEISSYLLVLVKNSGRKQKEIAEAAGINPVYINRWIKGNRSLSPENLQKVAAVLGVKITDLKKQLPKKEVIATSDTDAAVNHWRERALKAEAKLAHLERACAALGQHVSALGLTVKDFSKIISG